MNVVASGSFTATSAAKVISLRSDFDIFRVYNRSNWAAAANEGFQFEWRYGFPDGAMFLSKKADGDSHAVFTYETSGGFVRRDTSNQAPEAAKGPGTAITAANPAVVTLNSHGYSVNDRVRLYTTTGMLQIAGMEFTVTAVGGANNFTLGHLDASGFAAAATAVTARRIPNNPLFVPEKNYITKITAANPMVVTLSITHNLAVGDKVTLHVPSSYGMTQADGLVGEVTAVNTTNNTITLDINSVAFDAFAFPASGSTPFTFAHITPFGTVANGVDQALVNQSQIQMTLSAGADSPGGGSGDVMYWEAIKSGFTFYE